MCSSSPTPPGMFRGLRGRFRVGELQEPARSAPYRPRRSRGRGYRGGRKLLLPRLGARAHSAKSAPLRFLSTYQLEHRVPPNQSSPAPFPPRRSAHTTHIPISPPSLLHTDTPPPFMPGAPWRFPLGYLLLQSPHFLPIVASFVKPSLSRHPHAAPRSPHQVTEKFHSDHLLRCLLLVMTNLSTLTE